MTLNPFKTFWKERIAGCKGVHRSRFAVRRSRGSGFGVYNTIVLVPIRSLFAGVLTPELLFFCSPVESRYGSGMILRTEPQIEIV